MREEDDSEIAWSSSFWEYQQFLHTIEGSQAWFSKQRNRKAGIADWGKKDYSCPCPTYACWVYPNVLCPRREDRETWTQNPMAKSDRTEDEVQQDQCHLGAENRQTHPRSGLLGQSTLGWYCQQAIAVLGRRLHQTWVNDAFHRLLSPTVFYWRKNQPIATYPYPPRLIRSIFQ